MPPVFPSIYTATKVCATRLAAAYHHAHGLPVSHVRAFNAYGPGQAYGPGHPQKILPTFASLAYQGKPLPVWGDGEQGVDLVHADDLGRMLVDATRFGGNEVFDGGTGHAVSVNRLARFVQEVTSTGSEIEYLPMRIGETPTWVCATGDGWRHLGWRPSVDWNRIAEAVRSYRPPFPEAAGVAFDATVVIGEVPQ